MLRSMMFKTKYTLEIFSEETKGMKIFLLTPIYATTTQGAGATPVVHYFAKEWVKQGHEVYVYNLQAKFPSIFYWIGKKFQHQLNTRLGMLVPTEKPTESFCVEDGVKIHRVCMKKMMPHSEYKCSQIDYALKIIGEGCKEYGVPDVFVGHWDNPQMNILIRLKELYNRHTALVLHNNEFNLEKTYGNEVVEHLKQIDVIGFRSLVGKKNFEAKYFVPKRSFIASSGVADVFIKEGETFVPSFNNAPRNFVFVGSLIARKYPCAILEALSKVYVDKDFHVTFIGDGSERGTIESYAKENNLEANCLFTGRVGRHEIIEHLKNSDVFVMISSGEIFGLVYLEAMALGLIPIGSKNEGIDGIIQNGKNGFLCKAGDVNELSEVIARIKTMSNEELAFISNNAKKTAQEYSDANVAVCYLENLRV